MIIVSFWGAIIIYALKITLPYNALHLPFENIRYKTAFKAFFPEGFSFFTRDPRESQTEIFQLLDGDLVSVTNKNGSYKNWFGVKRITRAINLDIGYLLSRIEEEDWIACNTAIQTCLDQTQNLFVELKSNYEKPLLCGEYVLLSRKPVPWAWAKNVHPEQMPLEYVRIYIVCE
jgi:antimicrobial peptide system SdpA family protein